MREPTEGAGGTAAEPMSRPGRRLDTFALIRVLAIVGAILLVGGVVLWNLSRWLGGEGFVWVLVRELTLMFHLGREANVTTWYSALLLAAVALGLALHAFALRGDRKPSGAYLGLAAIALLMSADEAAAIHERMAPAASALGLGVSWTFTWLVLGVPFALLAGAVILWLARRIDPTLRRRLVIAGAIFLLGAIGFEMLGGMISRAFDISEPGPLLLYQAAEFIEESLEVAGALIALWATLDALEIRAGASGISVTSALARQRSGAVPG
jgi:hypothetical protein